MLRLSRIDHQVWHNAIKVKTATLFSNVDIPHDVESAATPMLLAHALNHQLRRQML